MRRTPYPPSAQLGEPLPELVHAAAAGRVLADAGVDLVHDHSLAGPLLARGRPVPTVVTVHGAVTDAAGRYYRELGDTVRLVAISDAQRSTAPDLSWIGTVHNGVEVSTYPYRERKDDYVLFLGRMSPDKGVDLAIDTARAAGRRIIVAGKCAEPDERRYFAAEIEPRLGPGVEFRGEADAAAKRQLLAGGACLLFPVQWDEPFGMVMIEAMACGTPVVALRRGSVPEVVVDGVTGYVRETPAQLAGAIRAVHRLAPAACRTHVERQFSARSMARSYAMVYREVLADWRRRMRATAAMRRRATDAPLVSVLPDRTRGPATAITTA